MWQKGRREKKQGEKMEGERDSAMRYLVDLQSEI